MTRPSPRLLRSQPRPSLLPPSSSSPSHQHLRTIKSIHPHPHRFLRYNQSPDLPRLTSTPAAALARKLPSLPLRPGALATKKGMTALFDPASGARRAATVLQLDRAQVLGHKTRATHGYWAVQIGAGWRAPQNVGRPMLGVFAQRGTPPKREVVEFRVRGEEGLREVGEEVTADWFRVGDWVDVKSRTRGMGFTGGMKRHGWSGQPASHGNSKNHRTMGSSGGGQGSGSRVHPGKAMAGRMGGQFHTVQNLRVLQVDAENGIVVVSGPVSGPKGCTLRVSDAKKKPWPDVPLPAEGLPEPVHAAMP